MKRIIFLIVGLVVLIWWFGFADEEPLAVQVHQLSTGAVEDLVANSRAGFVKAHREAKISPELSGKIVKILAREGKQVEKGEILFVIDDATLQVEEKRQSASLALAQAQLQEARANASRALRNYRRYRELKLSEQISEEELDAKRLEHEALAAAQEAAVAAVQEAQSLLEGVRLDIERCQIKAPFKAVVTSRWSEVGEWAVVGEPVLELVGADQIYVQVDIDETDVGSLREGLRVRLQFDPWKGRTLEGVIKRVSSKLLSEERQNRTLEVDIDLVDWDPKQTPLWPGVSVDAEIILNIKEDVLRLPAHALLENSKVWVLESGKVVEKVIRIGLRNWQWVEVVSGLREGEEVILTLDDQEIEPGVSVTKSSS